jgi:zona occludens toxin (predicted ATPase)
MEIFLIAVSLLAATGGLVFTIVNFRELSATSRRRKRIPKHNAQMYLNFKMLQDHQQNTQFSNDQTVRTAQKISQLTAMLTAITLASQEQIDGLAQVSEVIASIDAVTQQNIDLVMEAEAAAESLRLQTIATAAATTDLKRKIVGDDAASAKPGFD